MTLSNVVGTPALSADERKVAVIIPFYQRKPGILKRALESIVSQTLSAGIVTRIYVMDDSSPVTAESEATDFMPSPAHDLCIAREENLGPGGARNRGLALAEQEGADFIAFLDSDDIWAPSHLSDALEALDRGYDFYCCDNSREGAFDRFSEDVALLRDNGRLLVDRAAILDQEGPVLGFPAHALDDEFVTGYLSHTSTVVLRASVVQGQRFDPDLRNASEDRMFWLTIALLGARVAISWRCNVVCGKGVNVFFAAYNWNDPATLERLGCQLLFAEKLLRMPVMTPVRSAFALERAERTRRGYSFLFLRTLFRGRRPSTRSFWPLLRHDPFLPLRMPLLFVSVLADRRPEARQF